MNPFVTFRDKDDKGVLQYYVLQRAFPHFLGVISTNPVATLIQPIPIAGYNMYVAFNGCLRGMVIPSYKEVDKEISETLEAMAIWYLNERILVDEKKYKKFKICSSLP